MMGVIKLYGLGHKCMSFQSSRRKFRPGFSTLFQLSVRRGTKIEIALELLVLRDVGKYY